MGVDSLCGPVEVKKSLFDTHTRVGEVLPHEATWEDKSYYTKLK